MPIDKSIKSNRLLQSKRYTQQQLGDAQEAFTSVLDINASEVYAQQDLIPTSSLIYSGSSQNGQFVTASGYNVLKFYYRQRLVPSDTLDTGSYNTWFFLDPTASIDYTNGVNAGVLNSRQQGNFISPKYAPTLGGNTEDTTPGYQVKLTDSTGTIIDPASYTFDYKDGVLQFNGSSGYSNIATVLTLTAYQYVGKTLGGYTADSGSFNERINNITGSFSTTGSLNSFTASMYSFSSSVLLATSSLNLATASLYNATSSIYLTTQSLYDHTASMNAYTASNDITIQALYAETASLEAATASLYSTTASLYAYTASQNILNGTYATTASNVFIGNQTITGSVFITGSETITGNLTVTDTITAQRLIVQTVSSSVIFSSGSNIFGNNLANTQVFTGSVDITGSLTVNGRNYLTDSSSFSTRTLNLEQTSASILLATASLYTATASLYAASASINAFSASMNAFTASQLVLNGKYATTGSNIFKGNQVISGSLTVSGSTDIFGTTNVTGSVNVSGSTGTAITANIDTITFTGSFNQSGSVSLTGSIDVTGSLTVNGRNYINDSSSFSTRTLNLEQTSASVLLATASLYAATASLYAASASINAFSASINAYTASTNATITQIQNATASIYNATASLYAASASINAFSASINSYTASNNANITQLYNETASLKFASASINLATASLYNATASLYAASASINLFSASINSFTASQLVLNGKYATTGSNIFIGNQTITGSLNVTNGITGSLLGTASFANSASNADFSIRTTQVDVYVKNMTGAQINKGTVVRIIDAVGDNPLIQTASYTDDNNSANTLGITTTNIPNDSFGYVISEGILTGINTDAYTAGQLLYLGANGTITGSAPVAPLHAVRLGEVLRVQLNNGSMYVRIDNGYELGELHDVRDTTTTSSYGDLLVKNGNIWINSRSLTGSYNLTGSLIATSINATSLTASNATIGGNLVVNGTASFNYVETISGSAVIIGQEYIILNTQSPASRFAGLKIYDSGSTNATASIVWDSERNHLIYQNASGSSYSGGGVMSGPRNTGSLGDETYPSYNRILRGQGGDHLYNSNISDNDTTVSIFINTDITGSLNVSNGITSSLFGNVIGNLTGTSSYAVNTDFLDGLDSTSFVSTGSFGAQTASFNAFSASINNYTASQNVSNGTYATTASYNAFSASINNYTSSNNITISQLFAETSSLRAATASLYAASASINTFTASINSYTSSNNNTISQLYAETASILAHTASINAFSASINAYTSSNNDAITSLYSATASLNLTTASLNTFSASILNYTASQNILNGKYATTGSNIFEGVQTINSNLVVTGSITAQSLFVQTITSSVEFVTGSTHFGTITSNTHEFTGSVRISGSLAINGVDYETTSASFDNRINLIDGGYVTSASFQAFTSSVNSFTSSINAATASYNTATASLYAASASINAFSASILSYTASQNVLNGTYATTASFNAFSSSINSFTSSINAATASYNTATASLYAASASINAFSASMNAFTASQRILNGTYATTGSNTFRGTETISGSLLISGSGTVVGFNTDTLEITGSLIVAGTSSLSGLSSITGSLGISGSTTITGSISISGSTVNNLTASYAVNADLLDGKDSTIFATTGSNTFTGNQTISSSNAELRFTGGGSYGTINFHSFNASIFDYVGQNHLRLQANNQISNKTNNFVVLDSSDNVKVNITGSSIQLFGSVSASNGFTGSLLGTAATASYVQNAQSASYWSGSINNVNSASYAATASYADNFTVAGTLTAQTLVVQTISSSVIYSSGSNVFGNDLTNTQVLTGSVTITGSLAVNDSNVILTNQTSSMSVLSSSFASTASYVGGAVINTVINAPNYDTIQFTYGNGSQINLTINNVASASFASTSSFASTASYWSGSITNALSSSFSDITNTVWTPGGTANQFLYQAGGGAFSATTTTANVTYDSANTSLNVANIGVASTGTVASSLDRSNNISMHDGAIGRIAIRNNNVDKITIYRGGAIVLSGSLDITNNGATGSLQGTASYASTASYWSGSIINAQSSSYALTASYALNAAGGGGGTQGLTTTFTQSIAAVTWSFIHNLNTRFPLVQVYDTSFNQVTPQYVSSSNASTVEIGFGIATEGYAVASMGGTLAITGSNVIYNQASAATTWSFNHGLNTQYPIFQIFNANDEVIIPEVIKAVDSASALIYFPTPVAGKAVASLGGISGSVGGGGSGAGFPFSGSAVITGSFLVSGSFADFTQVANFTGSLTGSLLGTASYAMFALTASTAPGYTVQFTQSVAAATWSFSHNMGTRNPIVQVYDSTYKQIIPNDIIGIDGSTAEIRFDYAQSGYAVMSNGGGLYITGSTSTLIQTSAATTWSFNHRLNTKYPAFEVYDSNDFVIIPANIRAIDTDNAELHFAAPQTGRAIANFSGINGLQDNAVSASYAASGSNFVVQSTITLDQSLMDYASVNSSIVGSNNLYTLATGSYTAAFFNYTVSNGANARAGQVTAVWNGGTVEYTDVSTNDIGSTNAVTASVAIVTGDVQFNIQTNTSGWKLKSTATFM